MLPYSKADDTAYAATFDARLSLRLRAAETMDIPSLWADITGRDAATSEITWTFANGATSDDLWVHFTARDGWAYDDLIEALSGAVTLNGDPVASDYTQFAIESETDAGRVTALQVGVGVLGVDVDRRVEVDLGLVELLLGGEQATAKDQSRGVAIVDVEGAGVLVDGALAEVLTLEDPAKEG